MPIRKLTIFTFGYDGWGPWTELLDKTVNSVEHHRGFQPPIWVDTRIQPHGRAEGFIGDAFADVVGKRRYEAIPDLGNVNATDEATNTCRNSIRIRKPREAKRLLKIALHAWQERRRVIYFCHCADPKGCHRRKLVLHLIRAAERNNPPVALQVVEWPGNSPGKRRHWIKVPKSCLKPAAVHLPKKPRPLWKYAGLPAGSLVRLYDGSGWQETVAVRAARFEGGEWLLPRARVGKANRPVHPSLEQISKWRENARFTPVNSRPWSR